MGIEHCAQHNLRDFEVCIWERFAGICIVHMWRCWEGCSKGRWCSIVYLCIGAVSVYSSQLLDKLGCLYAHFALKIWKHSITSTKHSVTSTTVSLTGRLKNSLVAWFSGYTNLSCFCDGQPNKIFNNSTITTQISMGWCLPLLITTVSLDWTQLEGVCIKDTVTLEIVWNKDNISF